MPLREINGAVNAASDDDYASLERGDVLYFPRCPFELSDDDLAFLLSQKQSARFHKNISYRPESDLLKGVETDDSEDLQRMHAVMRACSHAAIAFCRAFLPRYAQHWRIDYASFRPIEEKGRQVKFKARNDLIHIDAFPTRPSRGDRLLRIFTNINPHHDRVWTSAGAFHELAQRYAHQAGLPRPPSPLDRVSRQAIRTLIRLGIPVVDRPDYDRFMLRFHDFLKTCPDVQQCRSNEQWSFPPGSSWMCFTDATSHACLSGQYALEQTFMIARASLALPEHAPIAILEEMVGFPLADGQSGPGRPSAITRPETHQSASP